MAVRALADQGVRCVFGYPGETVLAIFDALFYQDTIRHILVRHEQAAIYAAEGYARSTGNVGCVLVSSGAGATNTVTGLANAMCDSIPIVVITGQVRTDVPIQCNTLGITMPCTKHGYQVDRIDELPKVLHEAFYVAKNERPGPVVIEIPENIQCATGKYSIPTSFEYQRYKPKLTGDRARIEAAIELMVHACRPVFYTGGGIINSGTDASALLREFVGLTGFPVTSTITGLGAVQPTDLQWLGMLGRYGTLEANLSMHDCDVMICIGARFDHEDIGRLDAFSPGSTKIQVDNDPSSINRSVKVDVPIIGDCGAILAEMLKQWRARGVEIDQRRIHDWWKQIDKWRAQKSLAYVPSNVVIKPQYAIQRLYHLTKDRDTYITTEVGQHQIWAAQYYGASEPYRWMTSGGISAMGFGLPAAIGAQLAHPEALVIDIAGDASLLMTMQELSTAVQHRLPIKIFILNNQYMGLVRQWQEILYGGRYSASYTEALPDFVKLAEACHAVGMRCTQPGELDDAIREMIAVPHPVIFDCVVDQAENCFPMILPGRAHNEMLLGNGEEFDANGELEEGRVLG